MAIIRAKAGKSSWDKGFVPTVIKRVKSEGKHAVLCEIGVRLLRGELQCYSEDGKLTYVSNCNPIYVEPQNLTGTIPDVIGFSWLSSYVIEVKTSRADFRNDKNKKHHAGCCFWYLAPIGVVPIDEVSDGKGLLEFCEDGTISQTIIPKCEEQKTKDTEIAILLSVLRGKNLSAIRSHDQAIIATAEKCVQA